MERASLELALHAAGVGVWTWDVASERIGWSPETAALFGLPRSEFEGSIADFLSRVHSDDRPGLDEAIAAALSGNLQTVDIEHRLQFQPDRWVRCRGRVIYGDDGKAQKVVGAVLDVTEERAKHVALRDSEERHRLFTELASDYVYQVDMRTPMLAPRIVAGSFQRTTGYTPEEIAEAGGWTEVMHPEDRGAVGAVSEALAAGRTFVNEYRIVAKDGSIRWLRDRARPILDPKTGELVELVGGVQDISERKQLEAELAQAQKLEALARLAGSVAHDVNNLLTVMIGTSELLALDLTDEKSKATLADLQRTFQHTSELTHSLLVFARRGSARATTVSLDDAIGEALPMLQRAVGERIRLVAETAAGEALVSLDRAQFETALLNLALNARDAMPEGGTLVLSTSTKKLGDEPSGPPDLSPGEYATVVMTDSGTGIAAQTLSQVFEPFFTTKGPRGTGLGLSTVYGIVRQLNGSVTVDSEVGRGTTFCIYLPIATGTPGEAARPVAPPPSFGGTEAVVVVEDDPRVRATVTRTLTDHGYRVTAFENAEQALAQADALAACALLLSDVRLPGSSGVDLVQTAQARHKGLRVLLMSGYVEDVRHAALLEQGSYPFLHKPFNSEGLARRVREVLDGGSSDP